MSGREFPKVMQSFFIRRSFMLHRSSEFYYSDLEGYEGDASPSLSLVDYSHALQWSMKYARNTHSRNAW